MFQIVGAFAEFEREIIRERVKSGVAHARAKGIRLGRPRSNVDPSKIASLRAEGMSLRAIGKRLEVSYGTVLRALRHGVTKSPEFKP
jgi:DNA invertase Pin-like site-specific DNA recombinase